jgi:hypothetical protein
VLDSAMVDIFKVCTQKKRHVLTDAAFDTEKGHNSVHEGFRFGVTSGTTKSIGKDAWES